jgi:hypothetical protein
MTVFDPRQMARALGGIVSGCNSISAPGPGHGPRDRSLSIRLSPYAPDGFVCYSHAGDDPLACKDFVRERGGLPAWQPGDGRDRRVDPSRVKAFDRAAIGAESERRERNGDDWERIKRAKAIWDSATDPRGTVVEKYLAARALVLDDAVANKVLRYHAHCPWRNEDRGQTIYIPALVVAFTSIDDNIVTAVHRIRLDQPEGWPKAERKMLGPVARAAVKLDPAGDTLHIGEGVETCMAARQLGHAPAWALGSAGMISKFPLLDGIERLGILRENDGANARAAQFCGGRWHRAGRKVQIVMPTTGNDLNEELMAVAS